VQYEQENMIYFSASTSDFALTNPFTVYFVSWHIVEAKRARTCVVHSGEHAQKKKNISLLDLKRGRHGKARKAFNCLT